MKEYVCLYTVIALDLEDKEQPARGLLFADSFTDAVSQLEETLYNDILCEIKEISLFPCIAEFTKDTYELMRKELEGAV